ncbi:MAG: carotenoid 1,2-hydratase [Proteobacteria bacterium]|nr:carotenoid 1,2-hydratase [Pseudomonadota bacterium]
MYGPPFDAVVAKGGYLWWYLDVLSDDGQHALTLIAFVGCVFSPFYARARALRPGAADALDFCALNIALHDARGHLAWSMTERDAATVERSADHLALGPSTVSWEDDALVVRCDERTAAIGHFGAGRPLRGTLRLRPQPGCPRPTTAVTLDPAGRHRWWPIAPIARAEVTFSEPALRFSGVAYHDGNQGDEALEHAFRGWSWSRAALPSGATAVLYDAVLRDGRERPRGWLFRADRAPEPLDPPCRAVLDRTRWRLARATRHDAGARPRVLRALEDTPFYARALLQTQLAGEPALAVHEQLDLERFNRDWVRLLLPFRMRRGALAGALAWLSTAPQK